MRENEKNMFKCLYFLNGVCKRYLSPCRGLECKNYGECGSCAYYHIPAGQYPCRACGSLKASTQIPNK